MLIEIGAAMAPYRDNFILLVKEGIGPLPNLWGLSLIMYRGYELNYRVPVRLPKTL